MPERWISPPTKDLGRNGAEKRTRGNKKRASAQLGEITKGIASDSSKEKSGVHRRKKSPISRAERVRLVGVGITNERKKKARIKRTSAAEFKRRDERSGKKKGKVGGVWGGELITEIGRSFKLPRRKASLQKA